MWILMNRPPIGVRNCTEFRIFWRLSVFRIFLSISLWIPDIFEFGNNRSKLRITRKKSSQSVTNGWTFSRSVQLKAIISNRWLWLFRTSSQYQVILFITLKLIGNFIIGAEILVFSKFQELTIQLNVVFQLWNGCGVAIALNYH